MSESQRESKTRTLPKTQERYFRDVNADPSTGQARRQREVGKESYGLGRFSCEQEKGAGECVESRERNVNSHSQCAYSREASAFVRLLHGLGSLQLTAWNWPCKAQRPINSVENNSRPRETNLETTCRSLHFKLLPLKVSPRTRPNSQQWPVFPTLKHENVLLPSHC